MISLSSTRRMQRGDVIIQDYVAQKREPHVFLPGPITIRHNQRQVVEQRNAATDAESTGDDRDTDRR
jgi:hypothetical protein